MARLSHTLAVVGLTAFLGSACAPDGARFDDDSPDEGGASSGGHAQASAGRADGGSAGTPKAGSGPTAGSAGKGTGGADSGPVGKPGFIHRSGRKLMLNGAPITLKGISFGNEVWTNTGVPSNHHSEVDFERVASWGMNVIRFYLNYATLEDDAAPFTYQATGWEWLDQNVTWAKNHDVYLILNMHVPQGGFQPGPDGNALWDVPQNQERLLALWRAIAERYKDEPIIAGYDLLNEPDVSSSAAQWQELAQRLVTGIREVDPNHLLVVERTNAVNQVYNWDGNMNWFLVDDPNVLYTFHFYGPFLFTHQYADWLGLGDGGPYPDSGRMERTDRSKQTFSRGREYLEAALQEYAGFGERNDVPIYLGEFGAIRYAFEGGKNGSGWVRDVVAISKEKGFHYSYHTYHEDLFGVFYGYGQPVNPNNHNVGLMQVLQSDFK